MRLRRKSTREEFEDRLVKLVMRDLKPRFLQREPQWAVLNLDVRLDESGFTRINVELADRPVVHSSVHLDG